MLRVFVICLSHEQFKQRYAPADARSPDEIAGDWMTEGCTGDWTDLRWRWSDDNVKLTKAAWEACRLNIDLQIYPVCNWQQYDGQPRLRLDTRGEPLGAILEGLVRRKEVQDER